MLQITAHDISTFKTKFEKLKQCLPESNFKAVDEAAIGKLADTTDVDTFKELIVQVLIAANHKK